MPQPHENTERWGGPGAAHENRDKPRPDTKGAEARTDTNVRHSQVSGGGGERDRHHGHSAKAKRDVEQNTIQKSLPGD